MKKKYPLLGVLSVLVFVFIVASCGQQHKSPFEVPESEQSPITITKKPNQPDTPIEIECIYTGCTRTPGYWKNHPDDWIGTNPNSYFFDNKKTNIQVLKTPPKKGDAYYILAHQFIATYLNYKSGASLPLEVKKAFDIALNWFWENIELERKDVIAIAEVLDAYNNGKMGVPHCGD